MTETSKTTPDGFSETERAAMRQRAAELQAQKGLKGAAKRALDYTACLEAIAALPEPDRHLAERYHVIVSEEAPQLNPKTWYGFPSYAIDDQVLTFFQSASKFDTRYATIGFNDVATLDDGALWPTVFAVTEVTPAVEQRLRALVRQATAHQG
ncbi:hypothetical protein [Pseudoclavibacter soli]|uniref:hypothetical protein n=1 Tax=Pseudoclavibacter soli TaxID=452623 RepID=UPI00040C6A55|nr:hypothetical protein [Pseudoclavibacter soli]